MNVSKPAQKLVKKQKRCQVIINKDTGINCGTQLTLNLAICNAGLSTGLKAEDVLNYNKGVAEVDDVVMMPGKSFCFIVARTLKDAQTIYESMHGQTNLAQNEGILYLSYCDRVPHIDSSWNGELPNGLVILDDFITPEEESILVHSVKYSDDSLPSQSMKHRQVRHFGYEFLYHSNNVDINNPLEDQIPEVCSGLWDRLKERNSDLELVTPPDQLTVNKYEIGQGIPPHVDTHSAFTAEIMSLSLLSDVVMEFKCASDKRVRSVYLPRRSLLVMTGESRYNWTHGITPRKVDIVPRDNKGGRLTCQERDLRISLTFRTLRRSKQCDCNYPLLCDTFNQNREKQYDFSSMASTIEQENVHDVYNKIGDHFSLTRHTPWPQVTEFLNSFEKGSLLLDVGCGNGKYLAEAVPNYFVGCDRSQTLLQVCQERRFNVFNCDCLSLPVRSKTMDGCYSIAVIHHLATKERRIQAVREMTRVLTPGGRALIYVWSKDQEADKAKSSYLKQNKKQKNDLEVGDIDVKNLPLPVHTNRTQFKHQDVLVPWKLKSSDAQADNQLLLRYYHVFEENELRKLCEEVEDVEVIREYYDQGNWCVEFKKKAS